MEALPWVSTLNFVFQMEGRERRKKMAEMSRKISIYSAVFFNMQETSATCKEKFARRARWMS